MTMVSRRFAHRTYCRALAALCATVFLTATLTLSAQDAQPPTSADQSAGTPQLNDDGTPKLDAAGNPITTPAPPPPPPPCVPAKHHKCPKEKKKKKEKPPKVEPANISRGIFTVDGVIGKAALNYSIPDLKFIYFYAPGIGAVVISDNRFPGAVEQKNAFNGHTLTVTVAGGHVMQLYSDDILLSKRSTVGKVSKENKKPGSAFIIYNSSFTLPTRFPVVGYGNKPDPPYSWPGSKMNVTTKGIDPDAPPVPTVLTPTLSANPCPPGQVLINAPPAPPKDGSTPPPVPKGTPPPKCVLPKDVPPEQEKYIPLDQRPRS
jgi:hypothetical protein